MKPGHRAPQLTADVVALTLAAVLTVGSAVAYYGAQHGFASFRRLFSPAAATAGAPIDVGSAALPEMPQRPALPDPARAGSPLPFAGEELSRVDTRAQQAYREPAVAPAKADGLKPIAAPPAPQEPAAAGPKPFNPPKLQPIDNVTNTIGGGPAGGGSQAFYPVGAQGAAAGPNVPAVPASAPLGVHDRAPVRPVSPAKPRARASGPQGQTSAISFGSQ